MSSTEAWPPKSAYDALQGSPSGRKKIAELGSRQLLSPNRLAKGTPSLLDRLRHVRREEGHIQQADRELVDEDEDEETLQLKLAAIEAKLKLKKLQRAKQDQSASSSSEFALTTHELPGTAISSRVEVILSPSKRKQIASEHKSPNRVRLGIDKGTRAAGISLRKVRTGEGNPLSEHRANSRLAGRAATGKANTGVSRAKGTVVGGIKSFSERMAESREKDRPASSKSHSTAHDRVKSFKVNHEELLRYQEKGGQQAESTSRSPTRQQKSLSSEQSKLVSISSDGVLDNHSRCDPIENDEMKRGDAALFEGFSGLHLSSRILPQSFLKRTLPDDEFTVYKIPDLLRIVKSPAYELPDEIGNHVVFGIVASKSQPLDHKNIADENTKSSDAWQKKWEDGSQNRKKFMAFTITDLKWTVDLYLFDTALPRYHRLSIGTVIAILNPSIMPPKKGREDTGAFSLALHNGDDTILEIGSSQHLGSCKALRKDGQPCGSWVDNSKTEICEFHLNIQIAKTQANRMGVNCGNNGLSGYGRDRGAYDNTTTSLDSQSGNNRRGLLPAKEGRGFDQWTGSHYYMTASARPQNVSRDSSLKQRSNLSAARMLDLDLDDPFIAEGQLARDREARLQKRLANQEQERKIARHLAKFDTGGIGADYMRKRVDADQQQHQRDTAGKSASSSSSLSSKATSNQKATDNSTSSLTDLKIQLGRKRAAQDVQLSPVRKKTRFLTSTGIKEAGRESTYQPERNKTDHPSNAKLVSKDHALKRNHNGGYGVNDNDNDDNDDDDDDDLDII